MNTTGTNALICAEAVPLPRVKSAPGLKWRNPEGYFEARWQCRDEYVARPDFRENFAVKSVKLWAGTGNPTLAEWDFIADTCAQLQQEMLTWINGASPKTLKFDGTISSLIHCYRHDPDSNFGKKKLRYSSRVHYDVMMRLLDREIGHERVADLRGRHIQRWYDQLADIGQVASAHARIKMFRILFGFGSALLEDPDCIRLRGILSSMKFKLAKHRTERLTSEQAIAIPKKAREMGRPSIAVAQAIQFECMFRQRDCIGEYVPMKEPGHSDLFVDGYKWLRGVRWEEIDENLILTHVTSKRLKEIKVNLANAPMVMEEFGILVGASSDKLTREMLPATGPIVVNEYDDLPWDAIEFRRWFRKVANACGIPKTVRNMDSRAGAISEAIAAGATLEHVRHSATHSDISMTMRYDRDAEEATEIVQKLRAEKRKKTD